MHSDNRPMPLARSIPEYPKHLGPVTGSHDGAASCILSCKLPRAFVRNRPVNESLNRHNEAFGNMEQAVYPHMGYTGYYHLEWVE